MHCININAIYFPNGIIEENISGLDEKSILMTTPNIGLTLEKPKCKYAKLKTDYFGGSGEQSAKIIDGENKTKFSSINKALRELGVVKPTESYDEFEYIGLGKFRSTQNFIEKLHATHNICALCDENIKPVFKIVSELFTNDRRGLLNGDDRITDILANMWNFDKNVISMIHKEFMSFDETNLYLDVMDAHTDNSLTDYERASDAWEHYCIFHRDGNMDLNPFLID